MNILKQNESQSARAEATHKGVNQRSKDVHPDVVLVEFLYFFFFFFLHACRVTVTAGDSGLRCCVCVTSFER